MKVRYARSQSRDELEQILGLQKQNSLTFLSPEEKEKEGFVTVSHTFQLLKRMNDVCPHIIVKDKNRVVGYALCMHPLFAQDIEVLKPMFNEIDNHTPPIEKYIVMGQICIHKDYRRKGVFRGLYSTMKISVAPEFRSIITEVDAMNTRSLQAHYAIGFKELKTYHFGGREWHLIILK